MCLTHGLLYPLATAASRAASLVFLSCLSLSRSFLPLSRSSFAAAVSSRQRALGASWLSGNGAINLTESTSAADAACKEEGCLLLESNATTCKYSHLALHLRLEQQLQLQLPILESKLHSRRRGKREGNHSS